MQRSMRLLSMGLALGLATTMAACSESKSGGTATGGDAGGEIKVGVVLDITGAGASLGVPERQTVELLAEQVLSLIHISEPTRPY